jgi:hypothetical protein
LVPLEVSSLVKKENPDITTIALFTEKCWCQKLFEMNKVFDDATKMINFIKQGPVHSRMFKKLDK